MPEHYTESEKVFMVNLYTETRNAHEVMRKWKRQFKSKPPAVKTILNTVRKFERTGSVANEYAAEKIRPVSSEENVERVKKAILQSPNKSLRKISAELSISSSTVCRIVQGMTGKDSVKIRRIHLTRINAKKLKSETTELKKTTTKSKVEEVGVKISVNKQNAATSPGVKSKSTRKKSSSKILEKSKIMTQTKENLNKKLSSPSPDRSDNVLQLYGVNENENRTVANIVSASSELYYQQAMATNENQHSNVTLGSFGSVVTSLMSCVHYVAERYTNLHRKDVQETPQMNYALRVVKILIEEAGVHDLNIVQSALLQDVFKLTDTAFDEIRDVFGEKVANIVAELTDNKLIAKEIRNQARIDNAPTRSLEAKLVEMASIICNLRELLKSLPQDWTDSRRYEYFVWAKKLVLHYYTANPFLAEVLKCIFLQQNI